MTNVMCVEFKTVVHQAGEDIDAWLTLRVEGRYERASWGYDGGTPAESPDVTVAALVDSATKEDLAPALLAPGDLERFEALALESFMDSCRGAL